MTKRSVTLFYGFQFNSKYFKKGEYEYAIQNAVDIANDNLKESGFNIIIIRPELTPGDFINSKIIEKIVDSDICVFEISDNNPNVFFELGAASSIGKATILLVNTNAEITIPSDLSGIMCLKYDEFNKLSLQLSNTLTEFFRSIDESKCDTGTVIQNYIWAGGSSEDSVVVISGEVKSTYNDSEKTRGFYIELADVRALVESGRSLSFLNPKRDIEIFSSAETTNKQLEGNIVSIGGPRSNVVTKRLLQYLELPWDYDILPKTIPKEDRDRKKSITDGNNKMFPCFSDGDLQKDVAFLAFGPNPFNTSKRFLLLSGLFSYGVLGAARSVSALNHNERNIAFLNSTLSKITKKSIVQVVSYVFVINGQAITPDLNNSVIEVV